MSDKDDIEFLLSEAKKEFARIAAFTQELHDYYQPDEPIQTQYQEGLRDGYEKAVELVKKHFRV